MLPALFLSHGSPQLVLEGGRWAGKLRSTGELIEKLAPELVLVVSAHWLTKGTYIDCSSLMRTIHDFSGFDERLYRFEYPARGNPELCKEIASLLGIRTLTDRGLDHGAWAILTHLFPEAQLPVSQLSIDMDASLEEHLRLGRRLKALRDKVVLIASGGLVHNLRDALMNPKGPPEWAVALKEKLKEYALKRDVSSLIECVVGDGRRAHPTLEHFIPLLYFLGALEEDEGVEVLYDGFEFGSIALTSFVAYTGIRV